MPYQESAEATRNFYRQQGEQKEKERILNVLKNLQEEKPNASWSPAYILKLVNDEA